MTSKLARILSTLLMLLCCVAFAAPVLAADGAGDGDTGETDGDVDDLIEGFRDRPVEDDPIQAGDLWDLFFTIDGFKSLLVFLP